MSEKEREEMKCTQVRMCEMDKVSLPREKNTFVLGERREFACVFVCALLTKKCVCGCSSGWEREREREREKEFTVDLSDWITAWKMHRVHLFCFVLFCFVWPLQWNKISAKKFQVHDDLQNETSGTNQAFVRQLPNHSRMTKHASWCPWSTIEGLPARMVVD